MTLEERASHLTAILGVPISLSVSFDRGGKKLTARPEILPHGHGFAFCCRTPYPDMATAEMQLDSYGSDIVNAWKNRRSGTAVDAYNYLESLRHKPRVELRIGGKKIVTAQELNQIPAQDWTAGETSLRFILQNDALDDAELSVLESAIGFALLLAGFQSNEDSESYDSYDNEEGRTRTTSLTRYERSWSNRLRCIAHHGAQCAVCGFDFGIAYGVEYSGMIEVHHVRPVSTYGGPIKIDPIEDLVPLCPNCHAAIHHTNPPLSPEELRAIYQKRNGEQ